MARSDTGSRTPRPAASPWASLLLRTGAIAAYWLADVAIAQMEEVTERHRQRRKGMGMLKRGPTSTLPATKHADDDLLTTAAKQLGIPTDRLEEMLKDGRLSTSVKSQRE